MPKPEPIIHRAHENDADQLVRALAHDMSANFMLLEHSFARLKESVKKPDQPNLGELVAHIDACLGQSRQFLQDLSRLAKTGRIDMAPSRVVLTPLIREVLFEQGDLLKPCAVDVTTPLPAVACNRQRLKQVLTNLVRNAVLHGCDPQGPRITISAHGVCSTAENAAALGAPSRLSSDSSDRQMVAIRVHDNGRGIEPRFHQQIFLPGRRLAGTRSDGSGMGLAIVRRIAEQSGGKAFVDPHCPSGTAVVVLLPAAPEQAATDDRPVTSDVPIRSGNRNVQCDVAHGPTVGLHSHQPIQRPGSRTGV